MAYTTIDDPSAYFKVQLYTGTGSSNAITFNDTDTDMQPDAVWIKQRDSTDAHVLFDAVRGVEKMLQPNTTGQEGDESTTLTAFGSDGFTVGSDSATGSSSGSYVSWNWKAGTTSGINATGADITPSGYSFDQTSGFSVVAYTGSASSGDALPHGLGAVPHMMIVKARTAVTEGWFVYHHKHNATPEDYGSRLDTTAVPSDNTIWNDTVPTSVLVQFSAGDGVNGSANYIAYFFTSKQGFSKFGGYEGNGNADGTFVYTGFRPAFVMIKDIDATGHWYLYDAKRDGYNPDQDYLQIADTAAEVTTDTIDLVSNGFKCRLATRINSSSTFIYAAFAEAPFVNSNGVPCNAR